VHRGGSDSGTFVRFTESPATSTSLFRPLDEAGLQRLDDDALIDYMRRARGAGHPTAGLALAILVYGHWANVERRIRLKVPEAHVEDLTGDVIADAIASAFDGSSVGEFVSWLSTITRRAIADFYRRGAGQMRFEEPAVEPEAPSEEGAVEVRDAIERVMSTLREDHRRVVDIIVFADGTAADAARHVPGISTDNAHQIASRFRRAVRAELEAGGDTGSG
jgi:DNA-directed RNA polymerase specialized sigma24 family protein